MSPHPFDIELHLRQHGAALRQLAGELLRDPASADDAVAEVWLGALCRPPRHQTRPGGWLATALRNTARRLRRGELRRARHEAVVMRPRVVEDHALVVAREELLHRLVAAVASLEAPYRDAIWQRYFEGKAPRDIARANAVPLATVKSRLQRGLAMLRERLGDGDGSDWREVFACAFGFGEPAAGAAAAGAAMTGGVLMATWTKVAAVVVAVAIAAMFWPRAAEVPLAEPSASGSGTPLAATAPLAPSLDQAAAPLTRDVVTAATSATSTPPVDTRPARCRGRVVDALTQAPLSGVTVTLGYSMSLRPEATGVRFVTAENGRFDVACDGARSPRIWFSHGERLEVYLQPPGLAAGQEEDFCDIPLPCGRTLSGRVVDEQGQAMPAGISISATYSVALTGPLWQVGGSRARTQTNGTFVLEPPVVLGAIDLDIHDSEFELSSAAHIVVGPRDPEQVVLVVRPRQQVCGVVVGPDGQPLAGIGLSTQPGDVRVRTAADGSFRLMKSFQDGAQSVTVFVGDAPAFAPPPPGEVPWGTTNVRIVLPLATTLPIEVVDADGAAVTEFGIVMQRGGILPDEQSKVVQRGRHDGGRLLVERIAPGQTSLRVLPADPTLMPSELLPIANLERLRFVLARRLPCCVEVVANAHPVADALVELALDQGRIARSQPAPTNAPALVDAHRGERVGLPGRQAERIANGRTAADGTVHLLRDPVVAGRTLLVHVPGRAVHVVSDPVFPADGSPLRVVLPEFGEVSGSIELRGRKREDVRLRFRAGAVQEWATPQPDGSFRSPALPAGRCEVWLALSSNRHLGVLQGSRREVRVRGDEPATVRFDLGDFALASVRGQLRREGTLPAGLLVDFVREGVADAPELLGTAELSGEGVFEADGLLPGTYRMAVRASAAQPALVPGLCAETFVLAGGEQLSLQVPLPPRRLIVHLRRPDGSAVRGECVVARCGGAQWPAFAMSAVPVDEVLVLDPAPMLPVEFRGLQGPVVWTAPVVMPNDRAEAEVTVVLPDAPR
ncbi:MAG TPA: RNA polymerase sigma factor [Planctomycetota bacterium]|nr:RNA polymerase sigma factor [Planctomycetota bacterium]